MWRRLFHSLCSCFFEEEAVEGSSRLLPEGLSLTRPVNATAYTLLVYGGRLGTLHLAEVPDSCYSVRILKLVCGNSHFVMLTDTSKVLTAGTNEYGQCGRKHLEADECLALDLVALDSAAADIATGAYHTLVLCEAAEKQTLWGFGHEVAALSR